MPARQLAAVDEWQSKDMPSSIDRRWAVNVEGLYLCRTPHLHGA